MEINTGRGYVYYLQYQLVWCVDNSNELLVGNIKERFREILEQIANDRGFIIKEALIESNYVYLRINCTPQHYIPDIVKHIKGVTAKTLLREYRNEIECITGKRHIWNPSYFVTTVNEYPTEYINEYLQKKLNYTKEV